ncbi:MAG: beta-N-acetylhexosaminidase [Dysgonomonas sp.]
MIRILTLSLFVLITVLSYGQTLQPQIIPQPQELEMGKGILVLNKKMTISCPYDNIRTEAEYLQKSLEEKINYNFKITKGIDRSNQIILIEKKDLCETEYRIDVTNKIIICEAGSPEGIFYAIQTLLQSIDNKDGKFLIPSMKIKDSPRFAWRGMMLDDSRHFFGKDVVKQILDVMAYLKMNRFHMHLTDEPAWRIEIKKYPRLTEVGSTGNWHDKSAPQLFYTQEDIKEIVAYAAERHIMVIPEIDMPGHATAASRAYPEISGGGTGRWEGFTFHPAKETTYQFLDDVLTEIAELFPAPYIHIGGDEVHYGNQIWFTDPVIQNFIKENDLKDEVGMEHYFIRRIADIVNSKGKKMIGWDEMIASGVTPNKAVIMWWRHDRPAQLTLALDKGFDVIMTPRIPCYFDFVQDNTQKIGRRWGDGKYNTLETVYNFPGSIENLIKNNQKQIMGMQASTWTERIADTQRLYYMIFPRLAAISEDAWTNNEGKNYPTFVEKIKKFYQFLDIKGINYFNIFDIESTPEPWGPNKADVIAEG